jgi:RimJ/RimL family protein N-acetyltransferase
MTNMTDPLNALKSFQQALLLGGIQLQRGGVDRELFVHLDEPNGMPRFTYVRLQRQTVTAFVELVICDPIEGTPCFQIGYAVPESYRSQGRAKSAVSAAIAELKHGLARIPIQTFYVEAIVGADNKASQRVAAETISATPDAVTDQVSGLPALHYVRKIGKDAGAQC